MADELGRPADGLDAANMKQLDAQRAKAREKAAAARTGQPQIGSQQDLPRSAAESAFSNIVGQQQAARDEAAAKVATLPPPLTDNERKEYETALNKVRELQDRAFGGQAPPEGVPAVHVLKKWRVRLPDVTSGRKVIVDYLRKLRRFAIYPVGEVKFPDGADVVEAYSGGEAWEKFKTRFGIVKTENEVSIVEMDSPEDQRLFDLEHRAGVIEDIRVPA